MAPALNSGDYFLVTKFAYDGQEPRRGDVVVFHAVRHGNVSYIKRIIGLPGERIQLKAGIVYIDGIAVPRRRVGNASGPCDVSAPCHEVVYEEALPGGRSDRVLDLSPIEADNTQVFAVPPNAYFVLGDNRDNSLDSRFDEISFVSRGDIIGRADYMYISDGHWTWQPVR
jgi:signal peptidase I